MKDEKFWYSRGYLPHFELGERAQFITIRLHDSMPQSVLDRWRTDLKSDKNIELILRERIETYLDQGYGECYLREPEIASIVQDSLIYHDGDKYRLSEWVVMPNHAHLLVTPILPYELSDIMHSIKSYTASAANKVLHRRGPLWQIEYHERFIRGTEHYAYAVRYIHMNPVKARLCKEPSDWEFGSAHFYQAS